MTDNRPITIPPFTILTDRDRYDSNPSHARFTVLHEGSLLPVGRMFGMDGQRVQNPLHAVICAVWDGKWKMVQCHPGEVSPKRSPHEYLLPPRLRVGC